MARKKSKRNLWIIIIVLLVIVASVTGVLMSNKGNDLIMVSIEKAQLKSITQRVSAVGRIQPELTVKISSETSGEIIFLGVREGDTVHKGDLLVKIKPDIFETQLEQYSAASEAAKMDIEVSQAEQDKALIDLNRIKELYAKEFVSKEESDRAQKAYTQAKSRYSSSLLPDI